MEEKSWRRSHRRAIMEEDFSRRTLLRNYVMLQGPRRGNDAARILEESGAS